MRKIFRIFKYRRLELFSFHSFWSKLLVLAVLENNFRTFHKKPLMRSISAKASTKMDLKMPSLMEGCFWADEISTNQ